MYWGPIGQIFIEGCEGKVLEADCSDEDSNPNFSMGSSTGPKKVPNHQFVCLNKGKMSKSNHLDKAEEYGGELIKVKTSQLMSWLQSILIEENMSAYISGKRVSSTKFVFDDDEEFPEGLDLWHEGEPNNVGGIEDCIVSSARFQEDSWFDMKCSDERAALYNVPFPIDEEDENFVCHSIEAMVQENQIWYLDSTNNNIRSRSCPNLRIQNNWKVSLRI